MRQQPMQGGFGFPRPGKAVTTIIAVNVIAYVLSLLLTRGGFPVLEYLALRPSAVFESGWVWQPFTYVWFHVLDKPMHLVLNMLWLWLFGAQLESWWGTKRFVGAYFIFATGGAVLTLLVALLSLTSVFGPLLGAFWTNPHVGASGGVIGITLAWGLTFRDKEMHFLFLGAMKGRTFVMIIIAFELLVALSFDATSSSSHFGGMIAAYVLTMGLWRPSRWKDMARRSKLKAKKRKIEHDLRVIQGGGEPPDDPSKWN